MTKVEELRELLDAGTEAELAGIERKVTGSLYLSDLIREGGLVTTKAKGWGSGDRACALSAAAIAAEAHGIEL